MTQNSALANSVSLPGKRMAAACVLFNAKGEILIVKPTYRPEWLLPGGSLEQDESPAQCCRREVEEEINLGLSNMQLLCLEYQSAHRAGTESVQFIFSGGTLDDAQIQDITLPEDEIEEYRFCSRPVAFGLLASKLSERLKVALKALDEGRMIYMEDKVEISSGESQ